MKLKIHPKKDYDKKYNFISNVEKKKKHLEIFRLLYPSYLNGLYHTDKGKTVKHLAVNIDLCFRNFEYDVLKLKQKH